MEKKEAEIQSRLRKGDREALQWVYTEYKEAFFAYLMNRIEAKEELEDLYQDSVVALFQNFTLKQLNLDTSSIKTYLFAIGKNKAAARFRGPRMVVQDDIFLKETVYQVEENELSEEQNALRKAFKLLGESCRELLKMHYYRGLTDKEVQEMTDYKDINTIKSSRSRCLKKLKNLINV